MTIQETPPAGYFRRDMHKGKHYRRVLARLHAVKRPAAYLEVGTATGATLAIAHCASIAIDPKFRIDCDVRAGKPACHLFEMTSDAFFAAENPSALLGRPIDLAFIDGMHQYEFALRDFMNVEAHCRPDSLVVLHDCLPVDSYMARRALHDKALEPFTAYRGNWAGDTWKAAWILQRFRPDLRIHAFDAPPTGLMVVTRLDPKSRVLRDRYDEAIRAADDVDLAAYYAGIDIVPTKAIRRPSRLGALLGRLRRFDFSHHLRAGARLQP